MAGFAGAIFRQESAQPHTARMSQACLFHITTLPKPARSPDSSPIEHFWDHLVLWDIKEAGTIYYVGYGMSLLALTAALSIFLHFNLEGSSEFCPQEFASDSVHYLMRRASFWEDSQPPGQPIGVNDLFTKHPTREQPPSSQSCQKTSKISHPDEAR
ncbi:hypothetical protein TNCV_2119141 [Trichonephila clavipes]|nr:hypothetical protein TNCV_2119141 [Trichonephila clavipes]